jgi:hypothetical protein
MSINGNVWYKNFQSYYLILDCAYKHEEIIILGG